MIWYDETSPREDVSPSRLGFLFGFEFATPESLLYYTGEKGSNPQVFMVLSLYLDGWDQCNRFNQKFCRDDQIER